MGYDLEGKLEDDKTPVFARRALRALRSALSDATKAVLPGKAKNGPTSSGASGARSTAINVPAVAVSAAVICAVWCLVRKPRRQAKRQISSGSLILKVPDLVRCCCSFYRTAHVGTEKAMRLPPTELLYR